MSRTSLVDEVFVCVVTEATVQPFAQNIFPVYKFFEKRTGSVVMWWPLAEM
jgi:hypothetical protein